MQTQAQVQEQAEWGQIEYMDLESVFWILTEIPANFASDMPYSSMSYLTLCLLHPMLKSFVLKEGKNFAVYCYEHKKDRWIRRKFKLAITDLRQNAKKYFPKSKGFTTDLSPLRRRALVDFYYWEKFINNKNYYLNWKTDYKNNILDFDDTVNITEQVKKHLKRLASMKKKELILYLSLSRKRKKKENGKEQQRPLLLPLH